MKSPSSCENFFLSPSLPVPRFRPILPAIFLGLLVFAIPALAQRENPAAPQTVTKLDGTKLFGLIEVTDDYTLRIQSDSGIVNLPLAALSQADFQKYSAAKDRSKDGRLWSERQNALEAEKQKKEGPKGETAGIEIQLSELAPLQPLIAAYESVLGRESSQPATAPEAEASPSPASGGTESPPTRNLFSGPGSFDLPTVPFASEAGELIAPPARSATESLGGVVPTGLTPP